MKLSDKELGMDREISRRDFINGAAALTAATAVPGSVLAADRGSAAADYPPLRTGLRGSHPGSYDVAHELTWQGRKDWGAISNAESEPYDLVVVGAGISGLAAAWYFRKEHPDARVLILDNHDDFGGHAKRNEFELDGKTIISYGGSQSLEEPGYYSPTTKSFLRDIGVDVRQFEKAYDRDFYRRFGLGDATFFDEKSFGVDRLVDFSLVDATTFLPLGEPRISARQAVARMPLAENTRKDLLKLLEARGDHLQGIPPGKQWQYLGSISYREFLERHIGIRDPAVFELFQGLTLDMTSSIEKSPAAGVMSYTGLPGLLATALADEEDDFEPYIHHFPDGNASIARLLVRKMIPRVAAGRSMHDIVLARFDYSRLDERESPVRMRLNSMAVRVAHEGPAANPRQIAVTYVNGGRAYRVRGKFCVMAGYNAMIPYICPELPAAQKEALALATKSGIIYTNVLLRNWRAAHKLGVGYVAAPGAYYGASMVDFPVSMGGYEFATDPDQPIVFHMERFAIGGDRNASLREQILAGRRELFATPFEAIERETRRQLAGILANGGFDPAETIAAITVNRWGHGYAYPGYYPLDPQVAENERPHVVGRQPHGRIVIANCDAGGDSYISTAIEQAHRAVAELG